MPRPPCVRATSPQHRFACRWLRSATANGWTRCSDAYFVSPLARKRTSGKQCGLIATGDYAPSLRSPWRAATVGYNLIDRDQSTNTPEKVIELSGTGKDINLRSLHLKFTDDRPFQYEFLNTELVLKGSKASISASVKITRPGEKPEASTITGSGSYIDGAAHIVYHGKKSSGIEWGGVLSLIIPREGTIHGFWLTETTQHKGQFAFGKVTLNRK